MFTLQIFGLPYSFIVAESKQALYKRFGLRQNILASPAYGMQLEQTFNPQAVRKFDSVSSKIVSSGYKKSTRNLILYILKLMLLHVSVAYASHACKCDAITLSLVAKHTLPNVDSE